MILILNQIQKALETIDPNVYYGTSITHPKNNPWDYIVFSRDAITRNSGKSGYTDVVNVSIVREEYVPESLPELVIDVMEALPGVKLQEGKHEFNYVIKPGTQLTIEMLTLVFTRARKR